MGRHNIHDDLEPEELPDYHSPLLPASGGCRKGKSGICKQLRKHNKFHMKFGLLRQSFFIGENTFFTFD